MATNTNAYEMETHWRRHGEVGLLRESFGGGDMAHATCAHVLANVSPDRSEPETRVLLRVNCGDDHAFTVEAARSLARKLVAAADAVAAAVPGIEPVRPTPALVLHRGVGNMRPCAKCGAQVALAHCIAGPEVAYEPDPHGEYVLRNGDAVLITAVDLDDDAERRYRLHAFACAAQRVPAWSES